MMLRPRLSRTYGLALLAIATLLVVSYFPFAGTHAATTGATILPSAGKPLVNLKNPQALKVTYTGSADAAAALQNGSAIPTALAAADFDADGAMDVVAGYATGSSGKNGGVVALMRGNPDAYAPSDLTLYSKAAKGNVPATFLPQAAAFAVPGSPDLLATGDFNRDGSKDVLVASRGGALYLLAGDGHGNLLAPQVVSLPGQVTSLAVTADGHVGVSTDGPNGPQLAILAPSAEGLTSSAIYPLPARGDAMAWGNLGGGADLAVGAGANVAMFYNALTTNPQTEKVSVPFRVNGLALGDFIWDRDGRTEISVLADDGTIHILQHGTLNTTPLTAAELPTRRAAIRGHHIKPATPTNPAALGAWTVAKQLPYTGSAPSGPVSPSAFNSPRIASSSTHDLLVLDAAANKLHILDTSGKTASPSADISFSGSPVAAFVMPQKIDASRDVVVLTSAQSAPMLITAPVTLTLNVTTAADEDNANDCNSSSTSIPSPLSLREAVCIANNSAPDTTIINVPAGTYSLTSLETGELQIETTGTGYNLTINGTGTAASTIIQQTDGKDRIFEEDFALSGSNPLTIQNVTLTGGFCTNEGDCGFGGGAILAGGFTGDSLTITNVVMSNNGANPSGTGGAGQANGGAIDFETPAGLTITNSTFSNNTASGGGGAVLFDANGSGDLSVTGSTFSNNTTVISGGGISATLETGTSFTISGSTFTGNKVTEGAGLGGGISAEQDGTVTVSDSRFVGNSAPGGGTGAAIDASTAGTLTNNWWGCNGGPGASGCDTAQAGGGGSDTFNPWLVLSINANPTQILPGATSTLTADLTHNSNGVGGFSVPNGTAVTFGGTLDSSVNPTNTTLTSGQATSTYTAGSSAGNGTGTAAVDSQTVSTPINILDSVTVTTNPANLSITVDGVTSTAPQTFNWVVGSSHTIATTSPQNVSGGTEQVFSSWSDGGAISHSVTAPSSSTTYTASFNTEYQLTTQASPSADGSVTPTSGQYFVSGASIPVTATPNIDFAFSNWTSTGGTFDSTTSTSTNFHMPAAATTVTGNFVAATSQITITTSPANLLVSVDGGGFVAAPLVETWNQGSSHTIATESPQSGGTGIQYAFSSWSDGGAISHSITVPTTATTYTASFATQYQLTTAANPSIGGTVSPTSGNYYNSGTIVPLTATPNVGYTFTNWTGNVANANSASTTITMTAPQSVTANFSLIIVASPTTTSVSSSNNPSFTAAPGNSVTFTATVTSNTTAVNEGTVTFSDAANDFTCSGGNTVAVSNGTATCTTSFSTEGSRVVTAAYNGTINFQASSGFITQTVNNHTVITGNQFCNQGAITVPNASGAATPYPSNIFVTGLSGNVGTVTVTLNNISSSNIAQTDLLLVGPTGAAIIPFANVGDGSTISGVNITLDDAASSLIPGGSPLTTGTYKPTSITGSTSLVFPAPAPTVNASNYAATDGAATLSSMFSGTAPNGTWALYAMDNTGNGAGSIGGGWCVNITPPTTQITITTSPANLLVSVDGSASTPAPLVENWVSGSSHTIATSSPQSGGTGVQYVWSSWSDSGAISHSITVPSTPTTYTASFNTQYQLTTQASPSADGTVTPASGGYYAATATIPVTATANAGFTFSNWTSTGGSFDSTTAASTNFHMPAAPATVTGNFITAAQPQVTLNPTSVNFGNVYLNTMVSQEIMVQNTGNATLTFTSITLTGKNGGGMFRLQNSCPKTLAVGHTCDVVVYFNANQIGPRTNTLSFFDNAPGSPQQVGFTATVINPKASFNTNDLEFGTVKQGHSKSMNVTITNTGTTQLTITSVAITGTDMSDFGQRNNCTSLAPNRSCIVSVTFTPTTTGPRSADLTVMDNTQAGSSTVSLMGTGD